MNDFSHLPLNIVYVVKDPNDQISMLPDLISKRLSTETFTRPPAPWVKKPSIINSKNSLEQALNPKSTKNTSIFETTTKISSGKLNLSSSANRYLQVTPKKYGELFTEFNNHQLLESNSILINSNELWRS